MNAREREQMLARAALMGFEAEWEGERFTVRRSPLKYALEAEMADPFLRALEAAYSQGVADVQVLGFRLSETEPEDIPLPPIPLDEARLRRQPIVLSWLETECMDCGKAAGVKADGAHIHFSSSGDFAEYVFAAGWEAVAPNRIRCPECLKNGGVA